MFSLSFFRIICFGLIQIAYLRGREAFPFELERAQRRACVNKHSVSRILATYAHFAPVRKSFVVIHAEGGNFGSTINSVIYGFLVAVATNRSLCIDRSQAPALDALAPPFGVVDWEDFKCSELLASTEKKVKCDIESKFLKCLTSVSNHPNALLLINRPIQFTPESQTVSNIQLRARLKLLDDGDYLDFLGCASTLLIRPGTLLRDVMTPTLDEFRASFAAVALHLRSLSERSALSQARSLRESHKHKHHHNHLFTSKGQGRHKDMNSAEEINPNNMVCIRDSIAARKQLLQHKLHSCLMTGEYDAGDAIVTRAKIAASKKALLYYVSADTDVDKSWVQPGVLGSSVAVALNPHLLQNTSISNVSTATLKAIIDFFLLGESDIIIDSCELNTSTPTMNFFDPFSYYAHLRRRPAAYTLKANLLDNDMDFDCADIHKRAKARYKSRVHQLAELPDDRKVRLMSISASKLDASAESNVPVFRVSSSLASSNDVESDRWIFSLSSAYSALR